MDLIFDLKQGLEGDFTILPFFFLSSIKIKIFCQTIHATANTDPGKGNLCFSSPLESCWAGQ